MMQILSQNMLKKRINLLVDNSIPSPIHWSNISHIDSDEKKAKFLINPQMEKW